MDTLTAPTSSRAPVWFWAAASLGLAWNVFGIVQYLGTAGTDAAGFEASGLTAEQAQVMAAAPAWLTAAFAIGVFGGVIGCIGLLLRRRWSKLVLGLSLVAYVLLWIGDAIVGIFATLGLPQVIILTMVVAIAGALFVLARAATRNGMLR